MKLTDEENRQRLSAAWRCNLCDNDIGKEYCGYCDEYYNVGHAEGCKNISSRDNHAGHEGSIQRYSRGTE